MTRKQLQTLIKRLGGPTKVANDLAALGYRRVTYAAVCQWSRVPDDLVLGIEKLAAGLTSRHQLRPDIFGLGSDERSAA